MGKGTSIEFGSHKNLPHYAVIGEPQSFYLWVNEDGRGEHSEWLAGRDWFNVYHKLRNLWVKNKAQFCTEVKRYHAANQKPNNY